jgi:hypothetical protein
MKALVSKRRKCAIATGTRIHYAESFVARKTECLESMAGTAVGIVPASLDGVA